MKTLKKYNLTDIIILTQSFVKEQLMEAEAGHDWWHIQRVWNMCKNLAEGENVDFMVIELAALLHDIADSKFHDGDEEIGPIRARKYLEQFSLETERIDHIVNIIRYMSYKGGYNEGKFDSPEMRIVQDADRLDAIGAIGIARAFSYGGHKGRAFYNPSIPPDLNMSKETYKLADAPTINHFYEKLLLLKDLMKTEKGKRIAEDRHRFMELYLEQFYGEWEASR